MSQWLLDKLFAAGDQPTPRFALQSTLNWMRALTILVSETGFEPCDLKRAYAPVVRRYRNEEADIRAFECLLMAMHNVSALDTFKQVGCPYSVVRSAVIAWYYAIYESASAMTLAASGATAEQHAKTARIWHSDIVQSGYALGPFGFHLDTLIAKETKTQVQTLRNGSSFLLVDSPATYNQAWGAACGYVSGTAEYERWKIEERIRSSAEFKLLGVDSFRTKAARELRDNKLDNGQVNFLIQAFRYRGKANYRDSIYLSYGANHSDAIAQFLDDLSIVGSTFFRMARTYVSRRVELSSWDSFVADLDKNSRIEITPSLID